MNRFMEPTAITASSLPIHLAFPKAFFRFTVGSEVVIDGGMSNL